LVALGQAHITTLRFRANNSAFDVTFFYANTLTFAASAANSSRGTQGGLGRGAQIANLVIDRQGTLRIFTKYITSLTGHADGVRGISALRFGAKVQNSTSFAFLVGIEEFSFFAFRFTRRYYAIKGAVVFGDAFAAVC